MEEITKGTELYEYCLKTFEKHDQFDFCANDSLRSNNNAPNLPGVYLFYAKSKNECVLKYIGKAGTILQNGRFKDQLLNGRVCNKQNGMRREDYLKNKIIEEKLKYISIYWFVTYDDNQSLLPGYVESLLLQKYFELYQELPEWNKQF